MSHPRIGIAPTFPATAAQPPPSECVMGASALLELLFGAVDEAEFHRRLDDFAVTYLEPLLVAAVARRLGSTPHRPAGRAEGPREIEATEVFGGARLRLIVRLRDAWARRTPDSEPPIRHLTAYVEAAVSNACSEFRGRNPAWRSLHLRTRRVLDRSPGLECWRQDDGVLLAGFAEWRTQGIAKTATVLPKRLPDDAAGGKVGAKQFPILVGETLRAYTAPVPFSELLTTLAKLLQIRDPIMESAGSSPEGEDPLDDVPTGQASVEAIALDRDLIRRAWNAITAMPRNWRAAILLHRDDLLVLLWETDTARLPGLAAAVGVSTAELATLWNKIPLPDALIAERLGITVGSVRNCRSWALNQLRADFTE